jgi:hypothetical protein
VTVRPLERAYLRVLLDDDYAARLRDPAFAEGEGLTHSDAAMLAALPVATLDVERRARRQQLWKRAASEIPLTLGRMKARLEHELVERVGERIFGEHLWHPERTIARPPFGQGHEVATHVKNALVEIAVETPAPELVVLVGIATLEHGAFTCHLTRPPGHERVFLRLTSGYDLVAAAEQSGEPAERFALAAPAVWQVTTRGRVGVVQDGG